MDKVIPVEQDELAVHELKRYRDALKIMGAAEKAFQVINSISFDDSITTNEFSEFLANIHSKVNEMYLESVKRHDESFANAHRSGWNFPIGKPPELPTSLIQT